MLMARTGCNMFFLSAGEDEEYVPPKTEVSEIKEEDSLYSKRYSTYYHPL